MRALEYAVRGLRDELNAARTTSGGMGAAQPAGSPESVVAAESAVTPDARVHLIVPPQPVAAQSAVDVPAGTGAGPHSAPAEPLAAAYDEMFHHAARPAGPAPFAPRAPRPKSSIEALLAGRGLLFVGLLAVMIGVAYFLNYAFTHGWVGPLERILLGVAIGSALIVYAARRIGSDLTFLAESLIGLGAGIDYLSLWASVAVFPGLHVPRALAFAAMIVLTAVLALLATRRRSERLAVLGLIGGFITPLLLSSGPPDRPLLAGYLLVLSGTMLALSVRASFRSVETLTFIGVVCYAPAFVIDLGQHWNDVAATAVATLFFAMFASAFTLAALYDGKASPGRVALLSLNTAGYAMVLEIALTARQTALGVILLVVAAALLAAMRIPRLPRQMRTAYLYLGLAIATLAPPSLVHATSLIDVFSVEAALLVLIAARGGDRVVLVAGMLLFELIGVVLLLDAAGNPPQHALLSSFALAVAIYVAALGFAISRLRDANLAQGLRHGWRTAGIVTVHLVALAGLSRECIDVLGGPRGMDDVGSRAQFGLSAIWTLYATALFAFGMARREPLLRWLGLALFGCTIFKVFTVDLASLEVPYRILSFIGLGVVLVGVSAWYQRTMARQKAAESEARA